MTNITGYLYKPDGTALTTGKLYLTLQQDIVVGGQKVSPIRLTCDLSAMAPAGYVNLTVYPTATASPSGVAYLVEFDPDPTNTSVPMSSKSGYWMNYWSVPDSPTVAIGSFVSSLRGATSANYLPLTSPATSASWPVEVVTGNKTLTAAENGKAVIVNTTTATTIALPTPAAGLHYRVVINQITSSGAHAVNPGGGITINGNGLSKSAGQTLTIPADAAGDYVDLVALNSTTWWIVGSRGSWQ